MINGYQTEFSVKWQSVSVCFPIHGHNFVYGSEGYVVSKKTGMAVIFCHCHGKLIHHSDSGHPSFCRLGGLVQLGTIPKLL